MQKILHKQKRLYICAFFIHLYATADKVEKDKIEWNLKSMNQNQCLTLKLITNEELTLRKTKFMLHFILCNLSQDLKRQIRKSGFTIVQKVLGIALNRYRKH